MTDIGSDTDLIQQFRRGERIRRDQAKYSMYDVEKTDIGKHRHVWRCIVCCSELDRDSSECRICGKQIEHACTFEEECS